MGYATKPKDLGAWIERGHRYALTLPTKTAKSATTRKTTAAQKTTAKKATAAKQGRGRQRID